MAIAEMSKCTLVALKSDKDKVYDALQRTGAAQIKTQEEREIRRSLTDNRKKRKNVSIFSPTKSSFCPKKSAEAGL